jgi:hypothetical protein
MRTGGGLRMAENGVESLSGTDSFSLAKYYVLTKSKPPISRSSSRSIQYEVHFNA